MKRLLLALSLVLSSAALAQTAATPAESSLTPIEDTPGLPRVLIIGDSVSMGYTIPVRERLRGKANVHRIPQNGTSSRVGLERLPLWLGEGKWDVITFNFGLHDAKQLPEGEGHATLDVYEKNLRAIVQLLRASGAKLVWAATTPIPDGGVLSPIRRFDDITAYNAAARRVMDENGVAIADLYSAIIPQVATVQIPHDVHFKKEGSELLADRLAAAIEQQLPKR